MPVRPLVTTPPVQASMDAAGAALSLSRALPIFDYIEMSEDLRPGDQDKPCQKLFYDPDATSGPRFKTNDEELAATLNPDQGVYLTGERHLAYFHAGAGQRMPVPGVLFHLGTAVAEIAAGEAGEFTLYAHDGVSPWPTSVTVVANDWWNRGIPAGTEAYLFQKNAGQQWFAIPAHTNSDPKPIRFGLCQTNWKYNTHYPSHVDYNRAAHGCPFVTVLECVDSRGGDPFGDPLDVVLLPAAHGDPNLIVDDVIAFVEMQNGELVCVSDYLDDPIGTVKMYTGGSDTTRPGWVCMNGSQNVALTRTAEAWSMVELFPRGACSDGQVGLTGGQETHDHGGFTDAAGGHAHGGWTDSAQTGVSVYDPNSGAGPADTRHVHHNHALELPVLEQSLSRGEDNVPLVGDSETTEYCTSTERYGESSGCGTPIDLQHAVDDPGHQHAIPFEENHVHPISAANHLPPWRNLRFLERIDNSG